MRPALLTVAIAALFWSATPALGRRCRLSRHSSHSSSVSSTLSLSSFSSISATLSSVLSVSTSSSSVPSVSASPSLSSVASHSISSSHSVSPSPSPSPQCQNQDLIKNPTFIPDSATLPSWRVVGSAQNTGRTYGPSTDCGTNPGDPANCYEVYQSSTNRANQFLYQTGIAITPAHTYSVHYRYRILEITSSDTVTTYFDNSRPVGVGVLNVAASSAEVRVWKTMAMDWTAPTETSTFHTDLNLVELQLKVTGTGNFRIQFSDVSFNTCTGY